MWKLFICIEPANKTKSSGTNDSYHTSVLSIGRNKCSWAKTASTHTTGVVSEPSRQRKTHSFVRDISMKAG